MHAGGTVASHFAAGDMGPDSTAEKVVEAFNGHGNLRFVLIAF
jgi:hypothetical protein